jgi:VWFA-related protein
MRLRLLSLISILVAGSVSLAPRPLAAQDQPTFKSSSELVVMHVSVRDRSGHYITGLTQDAFTVIDDGKPQSLEMFSSEDVPASVGVLIDNSNSMGPSRDRVIASAEEFARHSHPQDELFVLTFNETVRSAWGPRIIADADPSRFAAAMSEAIVARGMTAIYDGILGGLAQLEHAKHTRQVLIVVSDGGDNASHAKLPEVLQSVHDSDATVYTVAIVDPLVPDGSNPGLLRRLAQSTGGEFYWPRRVDEVSRAFERIAKDIRSAYTIAYIPTKSGDNAAERRRRTVKVYVRSRDGRVLHVRARDGYFEKSGEERQ